jgi:hypothetical protein
MTRSTKSLAVLAVFVLTFTYGVIAHAQSDAVRQIYLTAANVPTNVADVHTYADPPKDFNPLTASDEELATYGFPTHPDKQADPQHYALWERAMLAAKIRWHGDLKPRHSSGRQTMPALSSPAPALDAQLALSGPSHWSNINASGVVLNNGLKKWNSKTSFVGIFTVISVPTAHGPFANNLGCTEPYYLSLSYAGIDGLIAFGQSTYFAAGEQAGVEEAVYCPTGQAYYNAFVGWGDVYNDVFALNPGDLFYTEIHAFGGCNNGSAFVEDLTTLTYNAYTITNLCLVPQVGNTANFVVDRLCCNGPAPSGAWPLANTIGISFEGAGAYNGSTKFFFPGSQATSTQLLTMTDDAGAQNIELVNQGAGGFQGSRSLYFETTGCAYVGGCTP